MIKLLLVLTIIFVHQLFRYPNELFLFTVLVCVSTINLEQGNSINLLRYLHMFDIKLTKTNRYEIIATILAVIYHFMVIYTIDGVINLILYSIVITIFLFYSFFISYTVENE